MTTFKRTLHASTQFLADLILHGVGMNEEVELACSWEAEHDDHVALNLANASIEGMVTAFGSCRVPAEPSMWERRASSVDGVTCRSVNSASAMRVHNLRSDMEAALEALLVERGDL